MRHKSQKYQQRTFSTKSEDEKRGKQALWMFCELALVCDFLGCCFNTRKTSPGSSGTTTLSVRKCRVQFLMLKCCSDIGTRPTLHLLTRWFSSDFTQRKVKYKRGTKRTKSAGWYFQITQAEAGKNEVFHGFKSFS